jgi:hypothetical protein
VSFADIEALAVKKVDFKNIGLLFSAFPNTSWTEFRDFLSGHPSVILNGVSEAKEAFPKFSFQDLEDMFFLSNDAYFDRWPQIREMFPEEK